MKRNFDRALRLTCASLAALSAAAFTSFAAFADTSVDITLRIEGIDSNIYYEKLTVTDTDSSVTAADALVFADKNSDKIEIKGAESGYITEINSTAAGKFGGYDGWYYSVNDKAPDVGVTDYELKSGDELTVYYGGFPCQIPFVETDKLESDAVIVFKSNDMIYDENFNATPVVNPVKDADVTVNGNKYKTNENGEVKLDKSKLDGDLSVQIAAADESGAPRVLRFAPDFTIAYEKASVDTDTASDTDTQTDSDTSSDKKSSDSDTSSDSNTKSSDSDKASDNDKKSSDSNKTTDSDKTSSSSSSSQNAGTSSSRSSNTTQNTTVTAPVAASTAAPADAAQTGDGRTYRALAVFAGAAILVVVLLLLGKVSKKKK